MKPYAAARRLSLPWSAVLPHGVGKAARVRGTLGIATAFLLVVALWLATHAYLGVVGDARFYNLQMLRHLSAGDYDADLYFRYGSQDEFSVFTFIFAPVIRAFGLSAGNVILNLGFQGLWLSGAWYLVRGLVRDERVGVLVTAMTIVMPGGIGFFRNAEPFLTPRPLAEALTLWALGTMLRGHLFRAAAVLAASLTIHPLMTLPGLGVLFFYLSARYRLLWGVAGVGLAAVVGLALLGVEPVSRLAAVFDPEWFSAVIVRDGFCFVSQWDVAEWLPACNTLAVAGAGLVLARPRQRRLLAAACAVAVLGCCASFVGGDLLRLVLVSDAQLWRAMWLLSFVANTCLVIGVVEAARCRGVSLTSPVAILSLAILLLALSRFFANAALLVTPVAAAGLLVRSWEHHRRAPPGVVGRVLVMVFLGVACALGVFGVGVTVQVLRVSPMQLWWTSGGLGLAVLSLLALWQQLGGAGRAAAAPAGGPARFAFAVVVVALAVVMWDQRPPWRRFIEAGDDPPPALRQLVAGGGDMFWEGDVTVPWFLLRQASYFSCDQGTGVLFKRGTALAYKQRYADFQKLGTIDFWRGTECPGSRNDRVTPLTRDDLRELCARQAGLGRLVLLRPVQGASGQVWVAPADFESTVRTDGKISLVTSDRFYFYACDDYRRH